MIEHYRKPTVKFVVNKGNFNKIIEILKFQEENIVTKDWKEIATKIREILYKYSIPQKDEHGDIAIIDIGLFPKEASEFIVLLISALENVATNNDYTQFIKRK